MLPIILKKYQNIGRVYGHNKRKGVQSSVLDQTDLESATIRPFTEKHPAPLPEDPTYPDTPSFMLPPKPSLFEHITSTGVVILCDVYGPSLIDPVASELYYYTEDGRPPHVSLWEKMADAEHERFPMKYDIKLKPGHRYHIAIRGVDSSGRYGPFSKPISVTFNEAVN